jgi:hypothetical protein
MPDGSGGTDPRIAGASARRRAAELLQLGLDQRGEFVGVRQRVRVGIAAEEELLAVADHPDRERMALGDGDDRVDLLELAARRYSDPRGAGDCETVRLNWRGVAIALAAVDRSGVGSSPAAW